MTKGALRYGLPAVLSATWALSLSHAQGGEGIRLEVSRVTAADGSGGSPVDLGKIQTGYDRSQELLRKKAASMVLRTRELKADGHHAGLPSCRTGGEHEVRLKETVPPRFRSLTLYFVRIPRGGTRPGILPGSLPEEAEVFVLDAGSLSDVAELSRTLRRRVSLASKEFAQAMGVDCTEARVTFSTDGRNSTVREGAP
jgi:hypothetical protein